MIDFHKKLEEARLFIHAKIDGDCDWGITFDEYNSDIDLAIKELSNYYLFVHRSYFSEIKLEAQLYYKIPYLHGDLWKFVKKLVYSEVKKRLY